ncbi:hypothetical protein F5890DRAFT_1067195 [Lentinula detonsa]|uniref:DUF6533 domain-containing protein n=1 Tax=Lentinula detonsa TaxID=2804962 RepID=A0AA38Q3A1_9AGAR|nr:hypothetical protein F5890DRAFT_1067195 [Lentinula detonsa]
MSSTIAQHISAAQQQRYEDYFHLFSITFLYWDHLITFPDEIQYLWNRSIGGSTALFFFNRYFASLGNIVVTVSLFSSGLTESLSTFSSVSGTPPFFDATHVDVHACHRVHLKRTGNLCDIFWSIQPVEVAAAWEALFLYDSMLFLMTLHKAYKTRHELRQERLRIPLVVIILRDGMEYSESILIVIAKANNLSIFARRLDIFWVCRAGMTGWEKIVHVSHSVMALANLVNISTFYYPDPFLRGALCTFASSMSVTMMSRLMINLHKIAETGLYTSHITTCQLGTYSVFVASPQDAEDQNIFNEYG